MKNSDMLQWQCDNRRQKKSLEVLSLAISLRDNDKRIDDLLLDFEEDCAKGWAMAIDTYFLDAGGFHSLNLIDLMLKNFDRKIKTLGAIPDEQKRSLADVIIMASILQREVRTPKDYEIVSGILWKRLDSNWHIGADATILYVTKKKTISAADLAIDSPYNTRRFTGMPPGPICNPDIEHIKAAFQPVASEYWYYLTTLDTGEVIYAKTNDEHNINKAKYLR